MNLLCIIQTKRLVDMWIYHEFVVFLILVDDDQYQLVSWGKDQNLRYMDSG